MRSTNGTLPLVPISKPPHFRQTGRAHCRHAVTRGRDPQSHRRAWAQSAKDSSMHHPRTRSLALAAVVGIGSGACGRLVEFRVGVSAQSASCFARSHTNTIKRRHSCHHWAKSRSSCSASGCRLSRKLLCVHLFVRCCLLVAPFCLTGEQVRLVNFRQVADSFGCVRQGNCAVCGDVVTGASGITCPVLCASRLYGASCLWTHVQSCSAPSPSRHSQLIFLRGTRVFQVVRSSSCSQRALSAVGSLFGVLP